MSLLAPAIGIEPICSRLTVERITNNATLEYFLSQLGSYNTK